MLELREKSDKLQKEESRTCNKYNLFERILFDDLIIKNWDGFKKVVTEIFHEVNKNNSGNNADYIPELKEVDSKKFGVSIVTIDGQSFDIGDTKDLFSVQSTSKAFLYSFNVEELGYKEVHKYIGKEPSGVAFNAFTLNHHNKPHNPLINAGGIMGSSLFHPEEKKITSF